MQYHLRTKFGESQGFNGGAQDVPFQGTAQGNGASPAMWIMISMYLVLLMHDAGLVSVLTTALTGLSLLLVGFLFVDDTDLVIFGSAQDTATTVLYRLQTHINY